MIISKSHLVRLILEEIELDSESLESAKEIMDDASDKGKVDSEEAEEEIEAELNVDIDSEKFKEIAGSLGYEEVPAGTMVNTQKIAETKVSRSQLRKIIIRSILKERAINAI